MITKLRQSGFTLVEIAIVLLIVTILLGYSVAMFPLQQELKQYRHVDAEMDSVIEHLIAFAQVNGRLPCPDTSGDLNGTGAGVIDGQEDTDDLVDNDDGTAVADGLVDNCKAFFGFLPARTLGMNGKFNSAGLLVDPWDTGYGNALSDFDFTGVGAVDLVSPNGIRDEGIANLAPDLFVCDDSTEVGTDLDCNDVTGDEVLGSNGEVSAIVISIGKDSVIPATSNIQGENIDNFHNGILDKVYIFAARRDDYDDVVRWIPTNLLLTKMIEADKLP
jgi:prepilin-type N-terminal cleavage/methylation domain-containing protein